jgi:predicted ATPase/DNA-binding winged helix-turn-helix (wHTH) protein
MTVETLSATAGPEFRFGPYRLLVAQRMVFDGDHPLRLGTRGLDILIALVEAQGRLLTKEDLVRRAWPTTFVGESALRTHISALRKVLGDGQNGAAYIQNASGRGYRFVAPVTAVEGGAAPPVDVRTDTLPSSLSRVVGRDQDIEAVAALLRSDRVVSVVGSGGIGKTTVAIAVAEKIAHRYLEGVFFVDLAAVADCTQASNAMATALSLSLPGDDPLPTLVDFLQERKILLLLDNCEHVIEVIAKLCDLLASRRAQTVVLATSLEPLQTKGERIYRLSPMATPPRSADLSPHEALRYPAFELFVQRMASGDAALPIDRNDVCTISELCERVDGVPLAIELLAARAAQVGVQGLAAMLDDRTLLGTAMRRTAPKRHRSLTDLVAWSVGLLGPDQRLILSRISVFRSAFTLDGAISVARCDQIGADAVQDALIELAAKSLLVVDITDDETRYRLLQVTRIYAWTELLAKSDIQPVLRAHADYQIEVMRAADLDWSTDRRAAWLARYTRDIDEVRSALDWAFGPAGDVRRGVTLTVAVVPLGCQLAYIEEFMGWVRRALNHAADAGAGPRMEMQLGLALGQIEAQLSGATPEIAGAFARGLEVAQQTGLLEDQTGALMGAFLYAFMFGDAVAANNAAMQLSMVAQSSGESGVLAIADRMQAQARHFMGDLRPARIFAERVLNHPAPVFRAGFNTPFSVDRRVSMRILLARTEWLEGRPDLAMEVVQEALAVSHDTLSFGTAQVFGFAAIPIALWRGDLDCGEAFAEQLVAVARRYKTDYWGSWAPMFSGVIAMRRAAAEGARAAIVRSIRPRGALQSDTLCTLASAFAGMAAVARVEGGGAGWCAAEILRASAEQSLKDGTRDLPEAEGLFQRALALARRQGARSWELRAATSLARLWERSDRQGEGEALLAPIYEAFREGRGTADLVEAGAVLERVS